MIVLSPLTLSKYQAGYQKAATVLSDYIQTSSKVSAHIQAMKEARSAPEPAQSFEQYSVRKALQYIRFGILTRRTDPPKGGRKTGEVIDRTGKTCAAVYQSASGKRYVVGGGIR